jgi:hypothetical protein
MSIIPALMRLRWEGGNLKFKDSLGYAAGPCLKRTKIRNWRCDLPSKTEALNSKFQKFHREKKKKKVKERKEKRRLSVFI